jgi:DHA1 family multidrug resistance protein-like MFS transporter
VLDRRALAILFLTLFLLMLGVGIIIPNIVYHAASGRVTVPQSTLLFTLYSLMQFLFAPLWGHLSDRLGRKPILVAGLLGNAVGLALFGVSSRLPFLYAARGLSGLMSSAALPTAMAFVADVTDEKSRGRGMGLMGAAMGLGFIFGPGIGGYLSRFGYGVPFLVAAGLNLMTCALAALLLPESLGTRVGATTAADREERSAPEGPLSSDVPAPERPIIPRTSRALAGPILPFYLVAFFVTFSMASLESIFPWYIKDSFGLGAKDMGTMFLFMGTAVFLVQGFLLGRWIGAAGEENVLVSGLLINAVGFLLVITAGGPVSLTAALVVGGVGNQIMRPTNASLITKRTRRGRGAAIGIMDSFDSAGRILGPMAAGALYGPDRRYPYLASAAIMALVGAVLWATRGARRRASAGEVAADFTSSDPL